MSQLSMLVVICNRKQEKRMQAFYHKNELPVVYTLHGKGTANSDILDSLGLESSEKNIYMSVVTNDTWKNLKQDLSRQMRMELPGSGIAFTIPFSSVGGRGVLEFLVQGQEFKKEEESTLKDTKYELLVAVANQGYIDSVMDAARSAQAYGGTVLHAKGTGKEKAEKFLGVSLAAEKEMIFIVTKKEQRNAIMEAIMKKTGLDHAEQTIVFSLPVTSTMGLQSLEDMDE